MCQQLPTRRFISHESMSTWPRNPQVFHGVGVGLYFSKPVLKHLVHIVDTMIAKGFSGTLTDLHHGSFHPNHRTTLRHVFTKSPWEEETLLRKLQQWILRRVERIAKQENHPLFVSIDDTIGQKTKPSSQAMHTIQGCDGHDSHTEKMSIWGHSLIWLMVTRRPRRFPLRSASMTGRLGKARGNSRSRCFLRWMYTVPFMC